MADLRWTGGARATTDVWTVTPGGSIGTETFTITVGSKSVSYTATGGDAVANVVAGLLTAWNAADDDNPEFAELTATNSTTHLTLTATVAGRPHTISSAATGSATLVSSNTTAATGPNHWDNADNFDTGSLPTTGDNVFIDNVDVPILYGLDQNSDTFASLHIGANVGGGFTIGLPNVNASGYPEYRPTHLYAEATLCRVGFGDGQGSGRIRIDFGAVQTDCIVARTSSAIEQGVPACLLKGTHADNVLTVYRDADVGVAIFGGEAATFATVKNNGRCILGDGCTLTTVETTGGSLRRGSNCTTHLQTDGESLVEGAATVTTLTIKGGRCRYNSSGTAGTVNVGGGAVFAEVDCSEDGRARTFTTANLNENGRIFDPRQTITYTNKVALGANVREVTAA